MQSPWKRLFQAAIVIRDDDSLAKLYDSLRHSPKCFPVRTFQVAAANEIHPFSDKRGGDIPARFELGYTNSTNFFTSATDCEPTPPQDFSRPNETDCDCRFCLEMQMFLASPTQETTRIAAREDRRQHLVDVIRSKKLDVTTGIEKTSSPHKLVLTKTSASYDRALKQYHNDLKLLASLPKVEG